MATIPRRPVAKPVAKPVARPAPAMAPKQGQQRPNTTTLAQRQANQPFRSATKPAQPKINPLAQQQPNPLQQAMSPQPRTDLPPGAQMRKPMLGAQPTTPQGGVLVNGQPFNPKPGTNQGMLPNIMPVAGGPSNIYGQPAPQPFNPQPNPGQSPMGEPTLPYMSGPSGGGFGGGKSAVDQPANFNNGYQVGGDINIDPATGQPSPIQNDSMPMDYGNQPNSYNGQLDLSGMMGQQGQQQAVPQNMYGTQPSATPGGKSTGSSSSNASYGGGKSQ